MIEVIGVRFNPAGKVYYFDPIGIKFEYGQNVIVETSRGVEFGNVAVGNKEVSEEEVVAPLKPILRKATPQDEAQRAENKIKEKEALKIALEKIKEHKLDMKLISTEYTFDRGKILFYFTADGRVDFRDLVKSLAGVFKTRIELRQIGVRDEAKNLGAIGICGRFLCCSTFLDDFKPVSIKMAKDQGLSLNPTKISGVCGRLMCCLQYEQNVYDEMLKVVPPKGSLVEYEGETGTVVDSFVIKGIIKVKFDKNEESSIKVLDAKDVKILKKAKIEANIDPDAEVSEIVEE